MNPIPYIGLAVAIACVFGSLFVVACHGHDPERDEAVAAELEREVRNWGWVHGRGASARMLAAAARHRRRAARARGIRP